MEWESITYPYCIGIGKYTYFEIGKIKTRVGGNSNTGGERKRHRIEAISNSTTNESIR